MRSTAGTVGSDGRQSAGGGRLRLSLSRWQTVRFFLLADDANLRRAARPAQLAEVLDELGRGHLDAQIRLELELHGLIEQLLIARRTVAGGPAHASLNVEVVRAAAERPTRVLRKLFGVDPQRSCVGPAGGVRVSA